MTMIVDTLKLSEELKAVGFAEPQARALANKFRLLVNERLVTKEYLDCKLQELRHNIDGRFNVIEGRLNGFEGKLKELSFTFTLRLGGLMAAIMTFFKIMDHFWR